MNWDDHAGQWESNPAVITFADKAFESLDQSLNLNGSHVLDLGCGTGLLSQRLSSRVKDVVAIDSSESMIEQLDKKELANVEPVVDILSRGLVAMHPAFRKQFDLVVASSVCAFLDNYSETTDIIYSLLDRGGHFVQWDWLAENEDDGMTKQRVTSVLSSVGFKDIQVSLPFSIDVDNKKQTVLMAIAKK